MQFRHQVETVARIIFISEIPILVNPAPAVEIQAAGSVCVLVKWIAELSASTQAPAEVVAKYV